MSNKSLEKPHLRRMKYLILWQIRHASNLADCRIILYYISDKFKYLLTEEVDAHNIPFLEAHKHVQFVISALHNKARYIYKSPKFNN